MFEISTKFDSANKKIAKALKNDSFLSWVDKSPNYISRGKRANPLKDNVIRILSFPEVSPSGKIDMIKQFDYTHNLVTDDGEIYYAIQGAGETPAVDEDFSQADAVFELGTTAYAENETDTFNEFDVSGTSKIAGSRKAYTGGYPQTNDTGDADNTGDAIDAVSYSVDYTTGDFSDTDIETGAIHDDVTPAPTTKLLAVWSFTTFAKTGSDTLKIFVNHAFENQ